VFVTSDAGGDDLDQHQQHDDDHDRHANHADDTG
jgi:hypothetical protein